MAISELKALNCNQTFLHGKPSFLKLKAGDHKEVTGSAGKGHSKITRSHDFDYMMSPINAPTTDIFHVTMCNENFSYRSVIRPYTQIVNFLIVQESIE